MFFTLMIPLVYFLSRNKSSRKGKNKKKVKFQMEPEKREEMKVEYKPRGFPSDEIMWMDTYGTIPPDAQSWPYGEEDYEKIRQIKLPKTVEEYYSHNNEFKRSKEFAGLCIPVKKVKSNFRDDKPTFRVTDPYEGRVETEEDRQRRAAWNNYQMDYHGIDATDKIVDLITNTLHGPQYHPHTYLPYNEPTYMPLVPGLHPLHNRQQNG